MGKINTIFKMISLLKIACMLEATWQQSYPWTRPGKTYGANMPESLSQEKGSLYSERKLHARGGTSEPPLEAMLSTAVLNFQPKRDANTTNTDVICVLWGAPRASCSDLKVQAQEWGDWSSQVSWETLCSDILLPLVPESILTPGLSFWLRLGFLWEFSLSSPPHPSSLRLPFVYFLVPVLSIYVHHPPTVLRATIIISIL